MRLIGYTYNFDTHCVDCAVKYADTIDRSIWISSFIKDSEGNSLHPIYDIHEGSDTEYCSDCHIKLLD